MMKMPEISYLSKFLPEKFGLEYQKFHIFAFLSKR